MMWLLSIEELEEMRRNCKDIYGRLILAEYIKLRKKD